MSPGGFHPPAEAAALPAAPRRPFRQAEVFMRQSRFPSRSIRLFFVLGLLLAAGPGLAQTGGVTGVGAPALHPGSSTFGTGLIDWFIRGGIFMWPLLLSSIVGLAAIIERWLTLRRAGVDSRRFIARIVDELRRHGIQSALETCRETRGPIAAVIHAGLSKADRGTGAVEKAIETAAGMEVAYLQRGLIILASVANIAPLLGFLGTVSGMINAFDAVAAADQVSARLVGAGIAEALITTEAGLCIAIPVQMFHNYFVSRIDRTISEMEESAIDLINELDAGSVNPNGTGGRGGSR
jgi:biopolymer transport protein ExbB